MQDMKQHKSTLRIPPGPTTGLVNKEIRYVLGKDLHYAILSNGEKLQTMCPTICKAINKENGTLKTVEDSCKFVANLIQLNKMDRIIPDPQYFANPKDPAVKRPK